MQWKQALLHFEQYLKIERGLSINSINSYSLDVQALVLFHKENSSCTPLNCSKEDVQHFLYEEAKEVEARSQARRISGLKSFFNFLIFEGYREDSPIDLIESPKLAQKRYYLFPKSSNCWIALTLVMHKGIETEPLLKHFMEVDYV